MIASGAIVPAVATIVMVLSIVLSGSDLKASDVKIFFIQKIFLKIFQKNFRKFRKFSKKIFL